MNISASLIGLLTISVLAAGCGDSGHSLGQSNGGSGGGGGGTTTGTGGGLGGTTGTGGNAGGGMGGAGGNASGGNSGGAGQGGRSGQGGAPACSAAPLVACPANEVCDDDTPNRCGAGYEPGHCIVQPQGCTTDYDPVCGCDGNTYSNDCARQMARIQLDHSGACGGAGGAGGAGGTGGAGGNNCGLNLSCDPTRTYCYQYTPSTAGSPPVATCMPFPSSCGSIAICECVDGAYAAGCACMVKDGILNVSCSGA